MEAFLQNLLTGIAVGSVFGMVALGFVLVFKSTDVLNFAHGEFLMIGSYFALTFLLDFQANFLLAIVVIALLVGGLGIGLHYGIMKPLVGQPLFSVVLVTIGIAIVLRAALLIIYGPIERGRITGALPGGDGAFDIGGAVVPYVNVYMVVAAIISVGVFFWMFQRTRTGLQMRAVAENLEAAAAMGVSPNRVFATAWAAGALMAGIGGVLYANFTPVIDLNLSAVGLRAFPAAMIGGLDSVEGAIVGGIIVGVAEQMAVWQFGGDWRDVVAFGLMFLVLMVRPYGFFGKRELIRV